MSSDSISGKKKELRKKYLDKRSSLSRDEVAEKSRRIHQHLYDTVFFKNADAVHSYVSMSQRNEVDTRALIQHLHDLKKTVFVPKMQPDNTLSHYVLNTLSNLHENEWGVPEPVAGQKADVSLANIVIVPMVSGDLYKNRLGYGKGYYDRFLKKVNAVKIGLLFDLQIHEGHLPVNNFDVPLDLLISESGMIL